MLMLRHVTVQPVLNHRAIRSSQSRVAKMEAGDPSVSLDLLVKSLLALGATDRDVASIIAGRWQRHGFTDALPRKRRRAGRLDIEFCGSFRISTAHRRPAVSAETSDGREVH